jgi:hypothetical protein
MLEVEWKRGKSARDKWRRESYRLLSGAELVEERRRLLEERERQKEFATQVIDGADLEYRVRTRN